MDLQEMKEAAKKMITAGVKAADPEKLVKENIEVKGNRIKICGKTVSRDDYDEITVLGIGKASVAMSSGCEMLEPDDGLVITDKNGSTLPEIEVNVAEHPYPEKANIHAAESLLSKIRQKENSLFIFLVSGGGSALFLSPVDGITVSEMKELNKSLVRSGADIHEINAVRKHLSEVKGGRLGKELTKRGDAVSLIISDVVGDELSSVASGPTCPDPTTFEDARNVLKRYDLWEEISESVREHLNKGVAGEVEETPDSSKVKNFLIGSNMIALRAAKEVASEYDFEPLILTSQNTGEAKAVAEPYMGIAKEVQDSGNPTEPPAALIFGGEMTVEFEQGPKGGKGGPNREFVLSSAIEIQNRKNIVVASADTDGTDGIGKAGALATTDSIERSEFDPRNLLEEHDSERFFDQIDSSIEFDSRTNVNDISVILVLGSHPDNQYPSD